MISFYALKIGAKVQFLFASEKVIEVFFTLS